MTIVTRHGRHRVYTTEEHIGLLKDIPEYSWLKGVDSRALQSATKIKKRRNNTYGR
jgi:hypothetical protein